MIESKTVADLLRSKMNKETPKTDAFEREYDEFGQRKYAQKSKRWWDKSTSRQIEHLICWFSRKFYNGSTEECYENCKCENCAFKDIGNKPKVYSKERNAERVFNRMGRPEMYICMAEALDIFEEEKLTEFINKTKEAIDKKEKWRELRKEYLTWKMIEDKVNS